MHDDPTSSQLPFALGQRFFARVVQVVSEQSAILDMGGQRLLTSTPVGVSAGQILHVDILGLGPVVELGLVDEPVEFSDASYALASVLQAKQGASAALPVPAQDVKLLLNALEGLPVEPGHEAERASQQARVASALLPLSLDADGSRLVEALRRAIAGSGVFLEAKLAAILERGASRGDLSAIQNDLKTILTELKGLTSGSSVLENSGARLAVEARLAALAEPGASKGDVTTLKNDLKNILAELKGLPPGSATPGGADARLAVEDKLAALLEPGSAKGDFATLQNSLKNVLAELHGLTPGSGALAAAGSRLTIEARLAALVEPGGFKGDIAALQSALKNMLAELKALPPGQTGLEGASARLAVEARLAAVVQQAFSKGDVATVQSDLKSILADMRALMPGSASLEDIRAGLVAHVLDRQIDVAYHKVKDGELRLDVPVLVGQTQADVHLRIRDDPEHTAAEPRSPGRHIDLTMELPELGRIRTSINWTPEHLGTRFAVEGAAQARTLEEGLDVLAADLRALGFRDVKLGVHVDPAGVLERADEPEPPLPGGSILNVRA